MARRFWQAPCHGPALWVRLAALGLQRAICAAEAPGGPRRPSGSRNGGQAQRQVLAVARPVPDRGLVAYLASLAQRKPTVGWVKPLSSPCRRAERVSGALLVKLPPRTTFWAPAAVLTGLSCGLFA